jgi:D-tyrosyl-tRNA(Tyr) deacylase
MRAVIQRVSEASCEVDNITTGAIKRGLLILLGIEDNDNTEDIDWLVQKLCGLRIFSDDEGKMNLSINDEDGRFLVISQFTLYGSTRKGNRPSFIKSAKPEIAIPIYESFIQKLEFHHGHKVETGIFGADMKISLVNDGPVTLIIDTKNKE